MCSAHPDSNLLNTLNNRRAAFKNKQTGPSDYFGLCSYTSIIYLGFESFFQHPFNLKSSSICAGGLLILHYSEEKFLLYEDTETFMDKPKT